MCRMDMLIQYKMEWRWWGPSCILFYFILFHSIVFVASNIWVPEKKNYSERRTSSCGKESSSLTPIQESPDYFIIHCPYHIHIQGRHELFLALKAWFCPFPFVFTDLDFFTLIFNLLIHIHKLKLMMII
jgi:hypothetical protein